MEQQFYVDLQLNGNQLMQAVMENVTSLPATAKAGAFIFLTTDKKAYRFDGSEWRAFLSGDEAKVGLAKDSSGLVYTLSQGSETIGTINIPKDMVVQSGSVVKGTFAQDGSFAESASGKDTALKLVIANSSQAVYINVKDLAQTYAGGTTADVTVAISDTNAITATLSTTVKSQLSSIANKVDKVTGKGLSTNDFTNADKSKLDALKTAIKFVSKPLVGKSGEITADESLLKTGSDNPVILQAYKDTNQVVIELNWEQATATIAWGSNVAFSESDNVCIHAIQVIG